MRKIISILLACCMLQGFSCVAAEQPAAEDCQAVKLFTTMGITDKEFNSDAYMTRAAFVSLAIRAMGKDNMPYSEITYTDVDGENPYYREIAIAQRIGVIGKSEYFEPDELIKYEEATKILVCMLGYEPAAEVKGGYPMGYISIAGDNKIFDNLSLRMGANLSGAEGATMIRNAWESKCMEYDFSKDGYVEKNKIYMSEYLDIYKGKGVLTSDGVLDFENKKLPDGKVKINNVLYKNASAEISEYFGEEIVYYYKQTKDEDEGTVLYAEAKRTGNITVVNDEDISNKTTISEFVYINEKDNEKRITLAPDVKVVYNGKQEFAYTKEMLMPEVGKVKLIDNNGDDAADTVISYNYETVVVNNYNAGTKYIVPKFSALPIKLEDYDIIYIVKNGAKIKVENLAEWDVLNICKSDNRFIAYVSNDSASGEITAVMDEAGDKTISIDGEEMPLSKKFIDKSGEIEVGNKGVFYKDIMGRVVCADYTTTSKRNYAVLLDARMENSVADRAIFKFFTKENKKESAYGAAKVRIDDVSYKPKEAVDKAMELGLHQLVAIDSNAKGEITKIDFAENKTTDITYKGYDDDNFTLDKDFTSKLRFYNNTASGCHVTQETGFWNIPQDRTNEELYKFEDYKCVWRADISFDKAKYYDLDKFNRISCVVFEDYDLKTPAGTENVNLYDDIFVVSDMYPTIDSEGVARTKLTGYHQHEYAEFYIAEEGARNVSNFMIPNGDYRNTTNNGRMGNPVPQNDRTMWGFVGHDYTQIKKGDIMQLGYNAKGDVAFYRMMWSADIHGTKIHTDADGNWGGDDLIFVDPGELYEINENPGTAQNPNFMSMGYTAYGEIIEAYESWFRYKTMHTVLGTDNQVQRTNVERSIRSENSVYIVQLNAKGAKVTKGSQSDISVGDKCFVHARDNHCFYMVLIRGID